jgi:hypothetical protein
MLLGLVLLAGGAYGAAYLSAGGKVPRGTTVAGVEIGGRTPAAAERALRAGLAARASAPIRVRLDGRTAWVRPPMSVDYAASVAEAGGGRSWRPGRLWDYYTGGDDLDPVVEVHQLALDRALDRLADRVGTPARDGAVRFTRHGIRVTDPAPGEGFDPRAAVEALREAYLDPGGRTVRLRTVITRPEIDGAEVQAALDSFANPAMSAPVTLVLGTWPVRLQPADFAPALRLQPSGGHLVPGVDEEALGALVHRAASGPGAPARLSYDRADVTHAFMKLLTRDTGHRRMRLPATTASAG